MAAWVEGRVAGKRQWTNALYSLQVSAPEVMFTAGQFARLLRAETGHNVSDHILKYDGEPFEPAWIANHVRAIVEKKPRSLDVTEPAPEPSPTGASLRLRGPGGRASGGSRSPSPLPGQRPRGGRDRRGPDRSRPPGGLRRSTAVVSVDGVRSDGRWAICGGYSEARGTEKFPARHDVRHARHSSRRDSMSRRNTN